MASRPEVGDGSPPLEIAATGRTFEKGKAASMPTVQQKSPEFSEVWGFSYAGKLSYIKEQVSSESELKALQDAEQLIQTPFAIAVTGGSDTPDKGHYQPHAVAALTAARWIPVGRRENPLHAGELGPTFWYKVFRKNKPKALPEPLYPSYYSTEEQRKYYRDSLQLCTNCGCGLRYDWRAGSNQAYSGNSCIVLSRTNVPSTRFPGSTCLGRFGEFTYWVNLPQKRGRKSPLT